MTFIAKVKKFAADESGAVTVDWVVLTAAIVGLGIAVVASVRGGVGEVGDEISRALGTISLPETVNLNPDPD
ncbi:MAG: hypothetical protein LAT78_01865 [Roseinatronobacter sp.]|jgi:Flp pilus assembly pilin Flp|nr:hypothetical protein [Roseinatronobacter sp.]